MSGPTISCGLDLGNIGSKNIEEVLGASVPDSVKEILEKANGVNGEGSIPWIRRNQVHLGEKTARRICNALKKHIWNLLVSKYENLNSAPPQVKTAMLDIAFQAGVGSSRMDGFGKAIEAKNWRLLGQMIRVSYSDFEGGKYHSIHRRRVDHGMQIEFIYNPPKNVAIDYD
jgi:GH24 family phage-related lysozyme (muramidase)